MPHNHSSRYSVLIIRTRSLLQKHFIAQIYIIILPLCSYYSHETILFIRDVLAYALAAFAVLFIMEVLTLWEIYDHIYATPYFSYPLGVVAGKFSLAFVATIDINHPFLQRALFILITGAINILVVGHCLRNSLRHSHHYP